jgi:hypothetical protein
MEYYSLFHLLKDKINYTDDCIPVDQHTIVCNASFTSENNAILPGESEYSCAKHGFHIPNPYNFENKTESKHYILDIHDSQVAENQTFRYHIFKPANVTQSQKVILLFHGFNEKYWHKYLPWAHRIMEATGKTIVLFPTAFHMNRAPHDWSDRRLMFDVSEHRKQTFPDIICSSLSNVAISTRLQAKPQRFFWSGLQTYYDVIQFIKYFKQGKHPYIAPDATIDIFAYSIGGLLSQILMMTNPHDYFTNTKLCTFCGGAVFNRMSPVSKFILDSEANVSLYSFIIEHLESHLRNDARLHHYFGADHPEGVTFRSMLNYKWMREFREAKFKSLNKQILAITLEKDTVMPSYEVKNTFQGSDRNTGVQVENFDFPYDYKHEDPFPPLVNIKNEVTQHFNKVFSLVSDFLK